MEKHTIMIVDDNPLSLSTLQTILDEAGYRVTAYKEAAKATAAAASTPPDLFLLDIIMPKMDGFDLIRSLKENPRLKDVPVLFLTSITDPETKIRGFESGAVDFITKPFSAEEILARVNTHLKLRSKEIELRKAYKELKQLETMRDTLVHMTVHDLRNPLTVLQSTLQLLTLEDLEKEARESVDQGLEVTRKMIHMVSSMLDLSRLESDEIKLNLEEIDLGELIRKEIQSSSTVVGSIQIESVLPDKPIHLRCDRSLISRVIQNLFSNALRYVDRKTGRITFRLTDEKNGASIAVQDNGSGIPEKYHEIIFTKFGQVQAEKYTSGLGLTLCKMVVETHNGTIKVESSPGKGSTFRFFLPYR